MVDRTAQTELNNKYPNQVIKSGVVGVLNIINILSTPGANPAVDKLTGDLVIEGFPNITEINLKNQKLTSLKLINCPNLEKIDVSGNETHLKVLDFDKVKIDATGNAVDADKLLEIQCRDNDLQELSFKYCSKLQKLLCQDNSNLDYFRAVENLKELEVLMFQEIQGLDCFIQIN